MSTLRNILFLLISGMVAAPMFASTWFIRPDGGDRYDVSASLPNDQKTPVGQCDGLADAPYPGKGINRHCAFNDVRFMWMLGTYGNVGWAMKGGDTLVIRGCNARSTQQNRAAPHCRIGKDTATNAAGDFFCQGVNFCSMPAPPSGTADHPTRILGACAYDGNCNPVTGYPYLKNNLTQLFAGFGSTVLMYVSGAKHVDVAGLELTTHNGKCARYGTKHPLPACIRGIQDAPTGYSDQADQGIVTNNKSADITLTDVYIHGFSSNGISGPIGGAFTLKRVSIDFNAFTGWNFDDGHSTPNGPNSSVTQSYVTMIGNGCQEEYPITHPQFPARGCWDTTTGGFGDAWSGQDTDLDSFTCDHCDISYNTKDGAMGPHTRLKDISLTNSTWIGNMGQSGKWGQTDNARFLFQNNIVVGNCMRLSQPMPGAAQNFDDSVNQAGSGLEGYCRAAGSLFDYFSGANSNVHFNNNTFVTYQPTVFEPACAAANRCGSSPLHFTNNLVLGYSAGFSVSPFYIGQQPSLFYKDDNSVPLAASNNLWFGIKNDYDTCGKNGNICVDPMLVNEPAHQRFAKQNPLDLPNFHPADNSPAKGHGKPIVGLQVDFYGKPRPNPPSIGAVEPAH